MTVFAQLRHPASLVVPISLTDTSSTSRSGQLYHLLKRYKAQWLDPDTRRGFQIRMAAILVRFLRAHADCIAGAGGGMWDLTAIVPSSKGTPPHALGEVMQISRSLRSRHADLLERGPGHLDFNQPNERGYVLRSEVDVHGKRILLIDDTYTTGARSQSAASALQNADARVVAILVVGRVVHQDRSPALWAQATKTPFSFETCCVHKQEDR